MSDTAEKLLDIAEGYLRNGGYKGFSFRDLASEAGIKSASVHHHFPTKANMTLAVASRYCERFKSLVPRQPGETPVEVIEQYRSVCRSALEPQTRMCLIGVLSIEADALCPQVAGDIREFYHWSIGDLSDRIGGADAVDRAYSIMAALQGAMMLAVIHNDIDVFERATEFLR